MPSLRELGEFEVIRRLAVARGAADPAVRLGPGDDAAVVAPEAGRELVVTTDTFVEGRHWLAAWSAGTALGARLAAANLSDLAAMAARPRWALLSIAARPDDDIEWLLDVQRGLADALAAYAATIVGGNLVAVAHERALTLALIGDVEAGHAWTREGARDGDLLAVTGWPGRAAAGLALARRLGENARAPEWEPLLAAWLAPRARVGEALALAATGAVRAAIDVSDGFAGDLARLCAASALGAEVETAAWPHDAPLERAAETLETSVEMLRRAPGDEYELLLAIDPARRADAELAARAAECPLAIVGRFSARERGIAVLGRDGTRHPLDAGGWDHFAR